ncbi:AcidPPc domain-containing protein [Aphelenchoides bicaudatus]|nr:AcidPPc domain-containing protein [Aphelenchoides bicaudatus]
MESSGNSLAEFKPNGNQAPTNNNRPVPLPIRHFLIDIGFILALFLGLEILARSVGPHESGFFCQDKSIRMPYAPSTVSLSMLIFYCVSVNLLTIFFVELYQGIKLPNSLYSKYEQNRSTWAKIAIRVCIFFGYYFAFELLVLNVTTYTKYPVGRLRPHFLEVCNPKIQFHNNNRTVLDGDCSGLEELFITNYTCLGKDKYAIKEARLSFFSGHSSLAMGASTYAILYLQFRLANKIGNTKLIVPVIQVIIGGMGLFISYSRIFDYKHHWTDVAVGISVGIIIMVLLTRFVAGFFRKRQFQFVEPPTSIIQNDSNDSQDQTMNTSMNKRSFEWSEGYA